MKNLKKIKKKPLLVFSLATLFVFVISGLLIFFNYQSLEGSILIKFDHLSGFMFFGNPSGIWHIWFTGLIIAGINLFLSFSLFYRERAVSYFLGGSGVFFAVLVFGIIGLIISVN